MRILANISPHPVGQTEDTIKALNNFFGDLEWRVVGILPIVPEIGNFEVVKASIKLLVAYLRQQKVTHVYIAAHTVFDSLIYQAINQFPELQVPRLLWDANRRKFWIGPPPLTRQDRSDIELGNLDIPSELTDWVMCHLHIGGVDEKKS